MHAPALHVMVRDFPEEIPLRKGFSIWQVQSLPSTAMTPPEAPLLYLRHSFQTFLKSACHPISSR